MVTISETAVTAQSARLIARCQPNEALKRLEMSQDMGQRPERDHHKTAKNSGPEPIPSQKVYSVTKVAQLLTPAKHCEQTLI